MSAAGRNGDAGAEGAQESAFGALPSPQVAVDDMRATAKWTLAALGAVGAVLVSGGPLVAVGQVHGVVHAVIAGLGLLLALAGIGMAIWYATDVLTPRLVTPATLLAVEAVLAQPAPRKMALQRRRPAIAAQLKVPVRHPLAELLAQVSDSPAQFFGVLGHDIPFGVLGHDIPDLLRHRALEANLAWQLKAAVDPARQEVLARKLRNVSRSATRAEPFVGWLLLAAHAELVKAALRRSRVATMAGGVLVVVGAVLFFSVTGSSGPKYVPVLTPAVTATPAVTPAVHPAAAR